MYCSECKLRVVDDSVVVCPVCQGPLQPESENEEKPETIDFAGELEEALSRDKDRDVVLEDKLDAYVRDDANLDFDPQELGLKSSNTGAATTSEDDIRVLADLWDKEDIGADLDGVFADAFNLEEVAPESAPDELVIDEAVVTKPEETVPESPVMSTPAPIEKSRNPGMPLLILIVLLIAGGGGWFYLQKSGSKSLVPVQVKPQIKPRPESAVVDNKPSADKATPVAESRVITQSQSAADAIAADSAGNSSDSVTVAEPQTASEAVAPVKAEVVAAGSRAVAETVVEPAAESPAATAEVSSTAPPAAVTAPVAAEIAEKSAATPEVGPPAAEKVASLPLPVKEKAVAELEKVDLPASPGVAATTSSYVVHIGSFRNEAGAARQLAKLQKKGFAAYKVEVNLGIKGVWQRIFVPGGESKSTALKVRAELAESFPREESLIRKLKK